jgi:hypothetical protein
MSRIPHFLDNRLKVGGEDIRYCITISTKVMYLIKKWKIIKIRPYMKLCHITTISINSDCILKESGKELHHISQKQVIVWRSKEQHKYTHRPHIKECNLCFQLSFVGFIINDLHENMFHISVWDIKHNTCVKCWEQPNRIYSITFLTPAISYSPTCKFPIMHIQF